MEQTQVVLMLGTSLDAPGGMTSVVRNYKSFGLFDRVLVSYVSTYEAPGALSQLRVFGKASAKVMRMLLGGYVALVHAHSASRGSFWRKSILCAVASLWRVPYVFHIHSGEFREFFEKSCGPISQAWVRRTLRSAARVIVLTPGWKSQISAIEPAARIEVIGNPVTMSAACQPCRPLRNDILFLGRLREKKGVYDLIRAMPLVLSKVPDARFVLAGDGELAEAETLARELGVSDALVLPGWVDGEAKAQLISEASVFTLPSYFEGLPVCILEALAARVPVVATSVGGIPDVISDGQCGRLVAPGDVDALADAIVGLLLDRSLARRFVEAGADVVERRFESTVIIRQIEQLYVEILARSVPMNHDDYPVNSEN